MNKFLKLTCLFSLLITVFLGSSQLAFSQTAPTLRGVYKIGPNEVAPNFKNIADAAIAVSNSRVLGRVVFEIKSGVYSERPRFFKFLGASDKNNVVFKSETNNAADVIIIGITEKKAFNHHIVRFQGATFTTLEAVTVINQNSLSDGFASAIHLTRSSRSNVIRNCILKVDSTITLNSNYSVIISTDEKTMVGLDTNASRTTIEGNQIIGGFFGIKLLGFSPTYRDNQNKINGNTFRGQYNAAIFADNNDFTSISNNDIKLRAIISNLRYGIYLNYCNGNYSIDNNKLQDCGAFGLYLSKSVGGSRSLIFNNTITGRFNQTSLAYGMYLTDVKNAKVFFNSINFSGGKFKAGTSFDNNSAFIITSTPNAPSNIASSKNIVKNNIFYSRNGAYAYFIKASASVDSSNYNNYFVTGGTGLAQFVNYSGNRVDLTALKAAASKDSKSISIDPGFVSNSDLHITTNAVVRKADYTNLVLNDFEKTPRDKRFPDIGADEFIRDSTDLEVFEFPENFIPKVGSNVLRVVLKNDGLNPLSGQVSLSYSINSGSFTSPQNVVLSGLSAPYSTQDVSFTIPWNIPAVGAYNVCVRVESTTRIPGDDYSANETYCDSLRVGLSGIYTIAGLNPDFLTFQSAVSTLNTAGVGGPVIFNIRPSTLAGQATINRIRGSSAVNNITFKSELGSASGVTITAAGSGANFHTIRLSNASNITFRDVTVENTSGTLAAAFHLTNQSSNITITDCNIRVNELTSLNEKIIGIVASSPSATPFFLNTTGNNANNITITNNFIKGGYAGIQLIGNTITQKIKGMVINNNFIDSTFFYGINTQFVNSTSISNNKINMKSNSSILGTGINIAYLNDSTKISGNYVRNAGLYGINLTNAEGLGKTIVVSNNMIPGGFKNQTVSSGAAIYFIDVNKIDLYNNSLNYDRLNGYAFFLTTGTNVNSKNNIFSNSVGGTAYYITVPLAIGLADNNNFFNTNNPVNPIAFFDGPRPDLLSLQAASLRETFSLNIDPLFVSPTDLHTANPGFDGKGDTLDNVLVDFDNEKRSPRNPDIGADEFILNAIDLDVIDVKPVVFSLGTNTISTEIANSGFNNLSGSVVSLSYQVNGGAWSNPETFTAGALLSNPYGSQKFNFATPFNAATNANFNICVRINPPGLAGDAVSSNNQLCKDICVGLLGGTYQVGFGKTYPTLASAASAISCGIVGPVIFNIDAGVYNEKVSIGKLKNTSEVNTVTFKPAVAGSLVVLTSGASLGANDFYTLQLNGATFIKFKDLTINNTTLGFVNGAGIAIHLTNKANNNYISNCKINVDTLESLNDGLIGISASSLTNPIGLENSGSNNTFENNSIVGGFYGIRLNGKDDFLRDNGNSILGNTITKSYSNGIFSQFVNLKEISGNTITPRAGNVSSIGVSIASSRSNLIIDKNKINQAGEYGILFDRVNGIDAVELKNNMIGGGFTSNDKGAAVNIFESERIAFYYNSLSFEGKGKDSSSATLNISGKTSNISLFNNNIANLGDGYVIVNSSPIDTAIIAADFNNYFSTSDDSLARFNGLTFADLVSYQEITKLDTSSISFKPEYFGELDLHTSSTNLDKAAKPLSFVSTDIDGELRNATTPDIGADEYTAQGNLKILAFISPQNGDIINDTTDVIVKLQNIGNSRIADYPITYTITDLGTNQVDTLIFDFVEEILTPNDPFLDFSFRSTFIPKGTGNYRICVKADFADDIDTLDNTLCINFTSGISDILDGSVLGFVSPTTDQIFGPTPITVSIKNVGFKEMTAFDVQYKNDGVVFSTQPYLGSPLLRGQTTNFTFPTSLIIPCIQPQKVVISLFVPGDLVKLNDTIVRTMLPTSNTACQTSIQTQPTSIGFLNVYPNPSNGILSVDVSLIESSNTKIEVLDLLGKTIQTINQFVLVNQVVTIPVNISDLPQGMYFIRLSDDKSSEIRRITIVE